MKLKDPDKKLVAELLRKDPDKNKGDVLLKDPDKKGRGRAAPAQGPRQDAGSWLSRCCARTTTSKTLEAELLCKDRDKEVAERLKDHNKVKVMQLKDPDKKGTRP